MGNTALDLDQRDLKFRVVVIAFCFAALSATSPRTACSAPLTPAGSNADVADGRFPANKAAQDATLAPQPPLAAVPARPPAAPPALPAPSPSVPRWQDLTASQQLALRPLKPQWDKLSQPRKRKWLKISKNFSKLSPAEQATMQRRMNEWVSLSKRQREQARINYAKSRSLTPSEKSAQWQAYQNLSPEQKKKLATKAPARPTGAAIVRPAAPRQLAKIPSSRSTPRPALTLTSSNPPVHKNTLLPKTARELKAAEGK